jgi:hypothetical protein
VAVGVTTASTMTTDLPPSFFLRLTSRHSAKDAFSGFILCDAATIHENGVISWKITPRPYQAIGSWTVQCPADQHFGEHYRGQCNVRGPDNMILAKRFSATTLWTHTGEQSHLTVTDLAGALYPVLQMAKHTTVFGAHTLKRNVVLQWLPAPVPGTPIPVAPAAPSVIQHVAPSPPLPKKPKVSKVTGVGTLNLFVAKQLLELAQTKHEMCPITAEEFITGETAVMPCGHLFMRMAIEETFKKEPNKCPACRQLGAPTLC